MYERFPRQSIVLYNNEVVSYEVFRVVCNWALLCNGRTCNLPKSNSCLISTYSICKVAFQLFGNKTSLDEVAERFTRDLKCLAVALNSVPTKGLHKGSATHHMLLKCLKFWIQKKHICFTTVWSLKSYSVTLETSDYLRSRKLKYVRTTKSTENHLEHHFGIFCSWTCDDYPSTVYLRDFSTLQSVYVQFKLWYEKRIVKQKGRSLPF